MRLCKVDAIIGNNEEAIMCFVKARSTDPYILTYMDEYAMLLMELSTSFLPWVLLVNYIPVLNQILAAKNPDVRNNALVILCMLSKDSEDTKERIANVDNAIESIAHSLGHRLGEKKLAVALLLELSKLDLLLQHIGKVQGCMLLLVTMASSDDIQATRDGTELLEKPSSFFK